MATLKPTTCKDRLRYPVWKLHLRRLHESAKQTKLVLVGTPHVANIKEQAQVERAFCESIDHRSNRGALTASHGCKKTVSPTSASSNKGVWGMISCLNGVMSRSSWHIMSTVIVVPPFLFAATGLRNLNSYGRMLASKASKAQCGNTGHASSETQILYQHDTASMKKHLPANNAYDDGWS